jgi:hypothetical protein
MKKYGFAATVLLVTFLSHAIAPTAGAKPSDLPVDQKIQCPECSEETRPPVVIDATMDVVAPAIVSGCVERLLRQFEELLTQPSEQRARELLELADRCGEKGEFARARAGYQQVHMLAPTSVYGRLAIRRLAAIEEKMREAAEESETRK